MSYNTAQPRHRRGAPDAGKWRADDTRAGATLAERSAPIALSDEDKLQVRRLQTLIRGQVHRKFQNSIVDDEEVFAETMEIAVNKLRSGQWRDIASNIGYLRTAAANKAIDKAYPQQNSATRMAKVKLNELQDLREQELGRTLSEQEFDDLADEVRMEAAPGRRARLGYHRDGRTRGDVGWDTPIGEDQTSSVGDMVESTPQESMSVWDRAADAMVDRPGLPGMSAEQLRSQYWQFAKRDDDAVPETVRLRGSDAAAAHNTVAERGVTGLLSDYEDDNIGSPTADALFAPFGGVAGTTDTEREAVMGVLTRNRDRAEQLWQIAYERATQ